MRNSSRSSKGGRPRSINDSIRFAQTEISELRQIGLDLANVRTRDLEQELTRWVEILASERLDLLEKIAFEMADHKRAKLPAKLRVVVPSSPRQR
jgi:hypothetical protein